jgi:hypothetical protein
MATLSPASHSENAWHQDGGKAGMIYGGTIQAEQEVTIRLDRLDQQAQVLS